MTTMREGLRPSDEARAEAGYGKDAWREILRSGEIPSARIGRTLYVREDDVRAYITRQFDAA